MSSPTSRRVEDVTLAITFGGAGTQTLTFARQTGPAGFLPPGPFNVDPTVPIGTLFTPVGLDIGGPTISQQRGTVFPNLLTQPPTDYASQAGVVSAGFSGTIVGAGNALTAINIVDSVSGAVVAPIYASATGLPLNDASIPGLLGRIPVETGQSLQVTIVAGGATTGIAKARYDLGLNAQQPEVSSTPASI